MFGVAILVFVVLALWWALGFEPPQGCLFAFYALLLLSFLTGETIPKVQGAGKFLMMMWWFWAIGVVIPQFLNPDETDEDKIYWGWCGLAFIFVFIVSFIGS